MRTTGKILLERNLTGIREVGDNPMTRIDEIHGLLDDPVTSLRRIPAKTLMTTGCVDSVWSIFQLRFRDRQAFMSQFGGDWTANQDLQPLPGLIIPETGKTDYPPNYDDADYPQGSIDSSLLDNSPLPILFQANTVGGFAWFNVVPGSIEFNEITGGPVWYNPKNIDLEKIVEQAFSNRGLCKIKINWDVAYTNGVRIEQLGGGLFGRRINNGSSLYEVWRNSLASGTLTSVEPFEIQIVPSAFPAGTTDVTLTFTAIVHGTANTLVRNPDGSVIQGSLNIRVVKQVLTDFVLTAPTYVLRGSAFNLLIRSRYISGGWDTTFVPTNQVDLTDNHPSDNISPVFTNNAGWVGGSKTVVSQITGGTGDTQVTVTAKDSMGARQGSRLVNVWSATTPSVCPGHPPMPNSYNVYGATGGMEQFGVSRFAAGEVITVAMLTPCYWEYLSPVIFPNHQSYVRMYLDFQGGQWGWYIIFSCTTAGVLVAATTTFRPFGQYPIGPQPTPAGHYTLGAWGVTRNDLDDLVVEDI